ncbi:hypothetical protein [Dyella kyungheensis]|uniref:Uncharacterized protein n=1 Tax=Dyella kyungheensis TaxID=1242174 RepID=A0ABS2JQ95_9GAMM|nr:hypothetical protein [Dyella kyungheensis]MBM7120980.1 hypothetical protein [Dyella kyungheensis]
MPAFSLPVIPAQAGIQVRCLAIVAMPLIRFFGRFRQEHSVERRQRYRVSQTHRAWIPAYAGMTSQIPQRPISKQAQTFHECLLYQSLAN